ncbi:MAG: 2-oxoacid:acceptor oxidoreductase family protein [Anaerolineales bacterium]
MRTDVRLSGFGGQGLGLAGFILGRACALYEGLEAVMTQSYGPEARGGASNADLVIADEMIDYPFVQKPNILVTLSQEAYSKHRRYLAHEGLNLIDSELVTPEDGDQPYGLPATSLAEQLGRRIVANVVMLGYFTALSQVVSRESIEESIRTTVKQKTIDLNLEAFDTGYQYAREREHVT